MCVCEANNPNTLKNTIITYLIIIGEGLCARGVINIKIERHSVRNSTGANPTLSLGPAKISMR